MRPKQVKEKVVTKLKNAIQIFEDNNFNIDRDNIFVAGSYITNSILDIKTNDLDIYFNNKIALDNFISSLKNNYMFSSIGFGDILVSLDERKLSLINDPVIINSDDSDNQIKSIVITKNAITFVTKKNEKIQTVLKVYGSPQEVIDSFDWSITQAAYGLSKDFDDLIVGKHYWSSLASRELIYEGTKYPLSALLREQKYISRGFSIKADSQLKLAVQLQGYDLRDPQVLVDQLAGIDFVYLQEFTKLLKEEAKENSDKNDAERLFEKMTLERLYDLINMAYED